MPLEKQVPSGLSTQNAAKAILEDAIRSSADRIVFPVGNTFKFAIPALIPIADTLASHSPQAYRLQQRSKNSWREVTGENKSAGHASAMRQISSGSFDGITPNQASRILSGEPQKAQTALTKYFRKMSQRVGRQSKSRRLDAELAILTQLAKGDGITGAEFIGSTLLLYRELLKEGFTGQPAEVTPRNYEKLVHKAEAIPLLGAGRESEAARAVILGKITSLHSRELAIPSFEHAIQIGSAIIKQLYVDMGVFTYASEAHAKSQGTRLRSQQIASSIERIHAGSNSGRRAVAYSVDPAFFRIYAPQILHYAQQLTDIDFHLILCAPEKEVESLIEDAQEFSRTLGRLNRSGIPKNVNYSRVPVPDYVAEPKTFYACARFYAATVLLEGYDSVHLLDADLTATDDPRSHFANISNQHFGAVLNDAFTSLSPWRRVMAGNVSVPSAHNGITVLEDVQDYVSSLLAVPNTWMIDQNALTFAFERNRTATTNLGLLRRPFAQFGFRATWENNFLSNSNASH